MIWAEGGDGLQLGNWL